MAKLIVSDTTAILHLAKIGEVNILKRLYTQILIPKEVFSELMQGRKTQPEILKVENSDWIKIFKVKNRSLVNKLQRHLDPGESEAIALSIQMNADLLINRVVPFDNLLIFRIFLSSICQLRGQRTGLLRKLIDS